MLEVAFAFMHRRPPSTLGILCIFVPFSSLLLLSISSLTRKLQWNTLTIITSRKNKTINGIQEQKIFCKWKQNENEKDCPRMLFIWQKFRHTEHRKSNTFANILLIYRLLMSQQNIIYLKCLYGTLHSYAICFFNLHFALTYTLYIHSYMHSLSSVEVSNWFQLVSKRKNVWLQTLKKQFFLRKC